MAFYCFLELREIERIESIDNCYKLFYHKGKGILKLLCEHVSDGALFGLMPIDVLLRLLIFQTSESYMAYLKREAVMFTDQSFFLIWDKLLQLMFFRWGMG